MTAPSLRHKRNILWNSADLPLPFPSPQTNLLYCPSGIELQTLAEWSSSPISHQFDVVSPSHIWVFAHVTQGQDPWVISFSSYLRQENLPKHCPTALNYAWMFAYTRLQLLSPQVDIKYALCYRLCCDALTSNNSWCRKQMIKENRRVASPHSITSSQTNPTRRFLFVHLQQPHQCQKGEQSEQQRFLRWPLEKLPDSLLQLRLFLLLNVFLLILHLRLRPLLPAWDAGVYAGQRLQLRFQGRKNTLKLRMTVQNKALTVQ